MKNENNDSNKELIKVNQILHYSFLSVFWSLYSKQNIILRTFIKNSKYDMIINKISLIAVYIMLTFLFSMVFFFNNELISISLL